MTKRVIWKYPLRPQADFPLDLPEGCRILGARVQRNQPVLYVLCDPKAPVKKRWFRGVITGEKFEADQQPATQYTAGTPGLSYIDTFVLYKGDFVSHLFEVIRD
jgi:hypothetical protein